ncbi:alginate export family protein [Dokdonella soli]|uniref:Alginate export family protein n=1 Tax=Dokdonella soli TaxID=529810 RepID=A0ABP3TJ26_9GAMM
MRARLYMLASPLVFVGTLARADEPSQRPSIGMYRWQEDWSFLADPAQHTAPGDALKYIALSDEDPKRYLSFGITLRERYEYNDAPRFGTTGSEVGYLIHRLELHADAHLLDRVRFFIQVENALALGLDRPGPADANKLDLRLAFIDGNFDVGDSLVKWRVGRQEMAFDLQRFISVRDGPNVRQAYDAIWADYERGDWRLSGFISQPVQYRSHSAFDDFSNQHLMYSGMRAQRRNVAGGEISATFSEYRNDSARFPAGAGEEHRRNLDMRWVGAARDFDWDVEGMRQGGSLGGKSVDAWAIGALGGYTFTAAPWEPRLGVQLDAASGDRDPHDSRVGTFNPMFPNGYYVTLSGYTGYSNFIHFKPSLTLKPAPGVKVLAALGALWRQTTHDAVFAQPSVALPHTAGEPGRRTADYAQLRIDWATSRNIALALEADRYEVARVVRNAGGHDSTYVGAEIRWGW